MNINILQDPWECKIILEELFKKIDLAERKLSSIENRISSITNNLNLSTIAHSEDVYCINCNAACVLPKDVISMIFLQVNIKDIFTMFSVCKDWNRFKSDSYLWSSLVQVHKPELAHIFVENLPLRKSGTYGKYLFDLDRFNKKLIIDSDLIKKDHDTIWKLNLLTMVILSPIIIPVAIKPLVFIDDKIAAFREANIQYQIEGYMKNNSFATFAQAKIAIYQEMADTMEWAESLVDMCT
jgi:hypothetical protein